MAQVALEAAARGRRAETQLAEQSTQAVVAARLQRCGTAEAPADRVL